MLNYFAVRGARPGKLYILCSEWTRKNQVHGWKCMCAVSLPYIENNKIIVRDGLQKVILSQLK